MNPTRSILPILGVVTLLLALWMQPWAGAEPPPADSGLSGPVIAKVGDAPIYLSQAQSRYQTMSSIHGETGILDEEALKARILDSLKFDVVMIDGAKAEGIVVTAPELAVYMTGPLSEQPGMLDQGLQGALDRLGVTFPELARRVYMNFLGSRVYQKVGGEGMSLTDREIRKYYRRHRSEFIVSEKEDPVVAFNAVKPEIAQTLIKEKQDAKFNEWFVNLAKDYEIQIVMEDWWNEIEKTKEAESSEAGPSGTPEGDASPIPATPTPLG